ncbi:DUF2236 domain-containing protein [Rhodococcus hoagii]|nr:DUF2236 domain-containing protein [Prescottella equi]
MAKHPWKRARTTFTYLSVAILGSDDERRAYREAVNGAHRHVPVRREQPGVLQRVQPRVAVVGGGVPVHRFEDTHQLLHGRMTPEQAEEFYRSSSTLGTHCRSPRTCGRRREPISTGLEHRLRARRDRRDRPGLPERSARVAHGSPASASRVSVTC